ncbi:MAG TPA: FAD-binding oxidoreductase [Candidatus Acidoferrales bacterium]|nr:FAD-binding oxidoreductase [Candidatus Acidoferrales bacterium]
MLIGRDRVRAPSGAEIAAASTIVEPESVGEISEVVRFCEAGGISLAPVGAARTLSQIRRAPVAVGASLKRLAKVVAYEPDDMTVVAEAGITVAALNVQLARSRQRLPVDPREPGLTSLGALIGASHAGPLRLSEGTARDLLIGIRFVGHGGAAIHGGGRVVKNVAGYDLMKVMGGSFGTLGIITEATFKVRPIPEKYCLAMLPYENSADAFAAASALNNALPLSNLDLLSPGLAAQFGANRYLLLVGFSGSPLEISYQTDKIAQLTGARRENLDHESAAETYNRLRDLDPGPASLVAQIAVPPAALARTLESCGAEFHAHAANGVANILSPAETTTDRARTAVALWRETAHAARGVLRIVAASPELRDGLEMFDTPNSGALAIMRRLKSAFDPAGIFNPGCFVGGI